MIPSCLVLALVGLLGFGRIGQATAKIAAAFGMEVVVYDLNPIKDLAGVKYVELDILYEKSDVISLHCPLTDNNIGMINSKTIEKMREGVKIINTSRGPLIDEEALAKALNSGKISGAALDVLAEEPARMDNPLLTAKNCIITPHIAWAPREARERLLNIAVDNLEGYLAGKVINGVY